MKSKLSVKLVLLAASTVLLVGICGLLYMKNLSNQEAKVTEKVEEPFKEEERIANELEGMGELEKLASILTETNSNFGGIYINEKGENVYLLKHKGSNDEKLIKEMNPEAKIEYVKYSAAEIREFQDLLMQRSDLGVQLVFAENNRIELLISEEMYEKHKEQILDGIDESILTVRFGTFKVIDQFGAA